MVENCGRVEFLSDRQPPGQEIWMYRENKWLPCYPEQIELCVLESPKSWDRPAYKRTHLAESSIEKIPRDGGHWRVGICLACCLTHDKYSISTKRSFTEGRKGRNRKEMRHLSGYTLDSVAYRWSSMVTSIFNFTQLLAFIEHYSVLLTDPLSPYAPVTHWGLNWQFLSVPQV